MANLQYLFLLLVARLANGDAANKVVAPSKEDLKTAESSYSQYSNWGGNSPGGYGYSVTGYGLLDDKYKYDSGYGISGYDGISRGGYSGGYAGDVGYKGYAGDIGYKGYAGDIGYKGYGYSSNGIDTGYGIGGYDSGFSKFDGSRGYSGYGSSGYGSTGYGGYGGYGGNGGLKSYSGYNNPGYQGAGHLGYGYYNKNPGYGNIYNNGITPSLVTGYRGYSRR